MMILIPVMSDVVILFLGSLAFILLLRGAWRLLNWIAFHPRALLAENETGPAFAITGATIPDHNLTSFFRMSPALQIIYCVLLLIPPLAVTMVVVKDWEDWPNFLVDTLIGIIHPANLFLTGVIYLLCPFSAWNIYWRRHDYIRFGSDEIEYRSGFKTAKLVPASITMFRGRSWRFDLIDLFRGEMATTWFLEILPVAGKEENIGKDGPQTVILDLRGMNLGGRARAIARTARHYYGDKFLIHNQLRKPG